MSQGPFSTTVNKKGHMKKLILSTVTAACLLLGAVQSQATIVTTFGGWLGTDATIGGTTWDLLSYSTPSDLDNLTVTFDAYSGLVIGAAAGSAFGGETTTFTYKITINSPDTTFRKVLVDSTYAGGNTTVTKEIWGDASMTGTPLVTASSINGLNESWVNIPAGYSTLWVKETLNLTGGNITGFANDYTMVPEPTTVLAGSLLLLPFAASTIRRFRKNKA